MKSKIDDPAAALPTINAAAALRLVTEMMAVPGRSGQERQMHAAVRARLKSLGVSSSAIIEDKAQKQSPIGGECGNLIVKLPGTIRGPRRLLMAHLDTVPICIGSRPIRRGDQIVSKDPKTALGADDRAGVSVLLTALTEIRKRKLPHPPLTFVWPVQEEIGLLGARYMDLKKLGGPQLCFNWDGGASNVATVGATGGVEVNIRIAGLASHAGARPEHGISAIGVAGMAIADLVAGGWHGLVVKGDRTGTSNIGIVTGGDATNVVAPELTIKAEVRSHDPQFRKQIIAAYKMAFEKAAQTLKNDEGATGRIEFSVFEKYESFRIADDSPVVQTALRAIELVGLTPSIHTTNGGLDANWLTARGLPTVTLGCGQRDVHTVSESLHVPTYLDACRIALALATAAV
ncbi:MAG TPA: M20/M25/M40 family metallo-hydrolase [Planctomycetaceae bacterium]|nr:M20/M25/M40 family metallo-hydrolase [Planctomycetaceae bacterium]